ncbi:hypothetical protein LENED_000058 [Lentinula edodes]|uniref:F-box domain-containing protein n=1 Tax=Lentinula edodes TaxID=5353 RepID=A0A1Q3DV78_LENED|nr:hypothetical protein LENED_000058 [Lentinula edodes]
MSESTDIVKVSLPSELQDMIIERMLDLDNAYLLLASLVCRDWRYYSYQKVFSSICFDSHSIPVFASFLDNPFSRPAIFPRVRRLRILGNDRKNIGFDLLRSLGALLARLHVISENITADEDIASLDISMNSSIRHLHLSSPTRIISFVLHDAMQDPRDCCDVSNVQNPMMDMDGIRLFPLGSVRVHELISIVVPMPNEYLGDRIRIYSFSSKSVQVSGSD